MSDEQIRYEDEKTGLTKLSTSILYSICNEKVEELKAYDPTSVIVIFVYDSEYKHNIFQLTVYRDMKEHCLVWRPFIHNALGDKIRTEYELTDFLGSFVLVEIEDMNLNDRLHRMVEENKITEHQLEKINRGGVDYKVDNKYLQEQAMETIDRDPSCIALPSVLAGYGMPGNNPYLNQYNQAVLAGKDAPPILTDEQVAERMVTPGHLKQTKSGIYLLQN